VEPFLRSQLEKCEEFLKKKNTGCGSGLEPDPGVRQCGKNAMFTPAFVISITKRYAIVQISSFLTLQFGFNNLKKICLQNVLFLILIRIPIGSELNDLVDPDLDLGPD
jgi:hypothetical protein